MDDGKRKDVLARVKDGISSDSCHWQDACMSAVLGLEISQSEAGAKKPRSDPLGRCAVALAQVPTMQDNRDYTSVCFRLY